MAETTVRIEVNHAGARELLRSMEVQEALAEIGERILVQAQSTAAAVEQRRRSVAPEYVLERHQGRSRARVTVATANDEARAAEAVHHVLLRALDAGRGI